MYIHICMLLDRMKKKVERKKRRIMLRKRAALAAMKGMMVVEIGTGRQVDAGLEETFAQMKGPRGAAPKLPKKLGKHIVYILLAIFMILQLFQALQVTLRIMNLAIQMTQLEKM